MYTWHWRQVMKLRSKMPMFTVYSETVTKWYYVCVVSPTGSSHVTGIHLNSVERDVPAREISQRQCLMDAMCSMSPGSHCLSYMRHMLQISHVVWLPTIVLCCCEQHGAVVAQSEGLQFPYHRVYTGYTCQSPTALKSKQKYIWNAW